MHKAMEVGKIINDAIIGRPHEFELDGRYFRLYPETLGKALLLRSYFERLDIIKDTDRKVSPTIEAVMICRAQRNLVCEIIALSTTNTKDEALDSKLIKSRTNYLASHLSEADMTSLLMCILRSDSATDVIREVGLNKEAEDRKRIAKVTGDQSVSFGGRTIYGTMIDYACERYGWTFDYVVWGISLFNLRMMLADAMSSSYLSEENMRKAHISPDREMVTAEQTDLETLREITKG